MRRLSMRTVGSSIGIGLALILHSAACLIDLGVRRLTVLTKYHGAIVKRSVPLG